jgi:hypothetical protein
LLLAVIASVKCVNPKKALFFSGFISIRYKSRRQFNVRTYSPKAHELSNEWVVIDATDIVLGRLATHAATLLRGKHKPTFAPHMDNGDFVVIINAEKVALTGSKLKQKKAYRHK